MCGGVSDHEIIAKLICTRKLKFVSKSKCWESLKKGLFFAITEKNTNNDLQINATYDFDIL